MNLKKKLAAEQDPNKVGLPKQNPLEGINSHLFVGTEDGDLVYVDWMPGKDPKTSRVQTPMPEFVAPYHDGPITFIGRSPFMPKLVLVVGGWSWSLWMEGIESGPLLSSSGNSKPLTGAFRLISIILNVDSLF